MSTQTLKNILFAISLSSLSFAFTGCAASNTTESTGQYIDSSITTTKVKTALFQALDADSVGISVETYKGTVQLNGFVNTAAQSVLAQQAAQKVPGVQNVQNNLTVKSSVGS